MLLTSGFHYVQSYAEFRNGAIVFSQFSSIFGHYRTDYTRIIVPFWHNILDLFVIDTKDQSHEKWNQNRHQNLQIGFKGQVTSRVTSGCRDLFLLTNNPTPCT